VEMRKTGKLEHEIITDHYHSCMLAKTIWQNVTKNFSAQSGAAFADSFQVLSPVFENFCFTDVCLFYNFPPRLTGPGPVR